MLMKFYLSKLIDWFLYTLINMFGTQKEPSKKSDVTHIQLKGCNTKKLCY
jgi:hypothetical protein